MDDVPRGRPLARAATERSTSRKRRCSASFTDASASAITASPGCARRALIAARAEFPSAKKTSPKPPHEGS
eukprot:6159737-Prymnesium_polylepis.1